MKGSTMIRMGSFFYFIAFVCAVFLGLLLWEGATPRWDAQAGQKYVYKTAGKNVTMSYLGENDGTHEIIYYNNRRISFLIHCKNPCEHGVGYQVQSNAATDETEFAVEKSSAIYNIIRDINAGHIAPLVDPPNIDMYWITGKS